MKQYNITVNGKKYEVIVESVTEVSSNQLSEPVITKPTSSQTEAITSPMQGKIVQIYKKQGDFVKKGEVLCVLEAMKLENDILASQDGTIKEILVSVNETVNQNQALIVVG